MKKIYIIKKISRNNTPYLQLYVDLGYRNLPLTFDVATIVELTGLSFEFVNNLEVDKPFAVFDINKVK